MIKFTETHEWITVANDVGTVGITDHAQRELGDIVYVELPKIGKSVKKGEEAVVLESTKAAADVYAPVEGTIFEVNEQLTTAPDLINRSSESTGWLFKLKIANPKDLDGLLDQKEYHQMTHE